VNTSTCTVVNPNRYAVAVATGSTRARNARGEGSKLREQLLRATTEILSEVGDANAVSVRAIARRAGVSPTALYLQFPDRDALVTAAVDGGFEAFNAALTEGAAVAGEPHERLLAMGRSYLEFSVRQPALYAILFSTRRPLLDNPRTARDRAFDGLIAVLRERDPSLDAENARQVALVVWSSLHGYAMLRTVRPHFDWPDPDDYLRRLLSAHGLG
jgi:AcrR family transcriptional regulator